MSAAGFPHSDTSASSLPYSFTELFAVWRVLLQFRVARHSPYALPYLISGSRVFRDVLFQELFFYCFLSLSYNLRFRPFLLCLFFLVAQFSKIDSLGEVLDLSKLNRYTPHFLQFPLFFFLLRKEVIHPHVPVGIPCYDLTPVIGPAFDGSLPEGLCHRLRALPTPMV